MDAGTQVVLTGALTFAVPLLWAVHELMVVRREDRGDWGGEPPKAPDPVPLQPDARPNLPDCLIPRLPARSRELEHV
jgi:hypothetical protein